MDARVEEKILLSLDLKKYLISTKSCRFKEGYILESKFGRLVFNFSDLSYHKIIFTFKKLSGNGKLFLKIGSNKQINSTILLKSYQSIELDLEEETLLEISRNLESTGEIMLSQITVIQKQITSNFGEEDLNWQSIIEKCGKYHQLRLIGSKLLAVEGSWIENENLILKLETEPPGLYVREKNRIKFLNSCEIKKIELDYSQIMNFSKKPDLYQHCEVPKPISPFVDNSNKPLKEYNYQIFDTDYHHTFDSRKSKIFINKLAKLTNSNAKDYLIIRRGGIFNIPIANLEDNSEYQVECTLQKLNGNGKIHLAIISDYYSSSSTLCVADNQLQNHSLLLYTKNGQNFKLQLTMKEDGVGEVLISRIIVNKKSLKLKPDFSSTNATEKFIFSTSFDTIKEQTENSALLQIEQYNSIPLNYEVQGCFEATNFYGKWWLSKILPFFPNLRAKNLSFDSLKTKESTDLLISSLDTLKPAKKIWLMEFKKPPQTWQTQILSQTKFIFTPSIRNYFFLKENFPQVEVSLRELTWPLISSTIEEKSLPQVVYLEKQIHHTKNLLQFWSESDPKLYIIGTNLKVPSYIQVVSKYESYSFLMKKIQESKVVIDLSDDNHYHCGFLNLCKSLGLSLVTNNQKYFTHSNVIPLKSSYQENNCYVSLDNLNDKIKQALNFSNFKSNSNSDLELCLKQLIGIN